MKLTIITTLTIFIALTSVFGQDRKDSLLVFVGQKIEVTYSPLPEETKPPQTVTVTAGNDTLYFSDFLINTDSRYIAKYKILQMVHGSYKADTIVFFAFDHYGIPPFSQYQTVLLFVSTYNGALYHEKYQFYSLYRTKNGKWASPYPSVDYNNPFNDSITVKPERILFKEEVSYPVDNLTSENIKRLYPAPYYKIKNGRATAIYGNYVDDLFTLKQQTVLKARGIY